MGEYIGSLSTLCCLCSLFMPMLRQGSKLKRYVAFSMSVICVCTVFSPLISFLRALGGGDICDRIDLTETENILSLSADEWILTEADHEIRRNISQIIKAKFNIPISENMITLYYDKTDYSQIDIIKAEIDVSDITVIKNLSEMRQYISGMLMCECEVKEA